MKILIMLFLINPALSFSFDFKKPCLNRVHCESKKLELEVRKLMFEVELLEITKKNRESFSKDLEKELKKDI